MEGRRREYATRKLSLGQPISHGVLADNCENCQRLPQHGNACSAKALALFAAIRRIRRIKTIKDCGCSGGR
jgi:hypothetical protein